MTHPDDMLKCEHCGEPLEPDAAETTENEIGDDVKVHSDCRADYDEDVRFIRRGDLKEHGTWSI